MIRLGVCCQFAQQPIKFRSTTATSLARMERPAALEKLAQLCRTNAEALMSSLQFCASAGIGAFRVTSQILPVKTHPEVGYDLLDLPGGREILALFEACGAYAREQGLRLSFHPSQFTLLSSPRPQVTELAIADLLYQAEVAEWIGADVINIHGGGGYGDKPAALLRLQENLRRLPGPVRQRLTLENDDTVYSPADLLPLCLAEDIPLAYDVHHHRVLADNLEVGAATLLALESWDREPMFHISSPKEGWDGPNPARHSDYINPADFPESWKDLSLTIEVEAKEKELAVLALRRHLADDGRAVVWSLSGAE